MQIVEHNKTPGANRIFSSSWSASRLAKVRLTLGGLHHRKNISKKNGREHYPTMLRISKRITIILQGKYLSYNFKLFFDMLRIVGLLCDFEKRRLLSDWLIILLVFRTFALFCARSRRHCQHAEKSQEHVVNLKIFR